MLAKIEDTLVISENNLDEIITNEEIKSYKDLVIQKLVIFFFKRSERKNLWCRRIRK